ncbi:hypothetical protein [Rhizohabitans arisaemae]|uniref:hypothetical protein n=1 Tax=Rhizohabitans arisaemae TaxID=2720610 RepID=UPI0024B20A09|nr:hypothetical protein [Rhizohabitans arisaemae]
MNDIDNLVKAIDPAPHTPEQGPGARELRAAITATEPSRAGRLSWKVWAVAVPAAALATFTAVSLLPTTGGLGPKPASALDFKASGDGYVVTVQDLYADPQKYAQEFKERGFAVELKLIPTSPSAVGRLIGGETTTDTPQSGPPIQPIGEGCGEPLVSCLISIRIPEGYSGSETLIMGRPPRPGEDYDGTGSIFAKGEILHCVPFVGMTVEKFTEVLSGKGVSIDSFRVTDESLERKTVPGSWLVSDATLLSPTRAVVWADPKAPEPDRSYTAVMAGCPKN